MKRNIFLYSVLSLFTVTTATGCDERSDNPMPDSAIRVETAEVTAITSEMPYPAVALSAKRKR